MLLWMGGAVMVAAIAGLAWYFTARTTPSASTLETWVVSQKYEPLRPMRSSYVPGTLVYVSAGGRDRVAMAADDFLGANSKAVITGRVPDTTLDVQYVFDAKGSLNESATDKTSARGTGGGGLTLRAKLNLQELETLTLPLDKVRDLVENFDARVNESSIKPIQ